MTQDLYWFRQRALYPVGGWLSTLFLSPGAQSLQWEYKREEEEMGCLSPGPILTTVGENGRYPSVRYVLGMLCKCVCVAKRVRERKIEGSVPFYSTRGWPLQVGRRKRK